MFLCFIINSFNNKTIDVMGAAILQNLLRLSMLRKPDVTSVVSQTVFVELRTLTCLIVQRSTVILATKTTRVMRTFTGCRKDALYVGNG